jgi:hypothetical protein
MATLKIIRFIAISLFVLTMNKAYSQIASWRPSKVPDTVGKKDVNSVKKSIQAFTYNGLDRETLVSASILLPPDEATKILKQYLSTYSIKTSKKDIQWAKTVFCFGLVNTKEAKEYLLKLWDECDGELASGKVKVPFSGEDDYNNCLAPIADALRFYLNDSDMQSWVYRRYEEVNNIKEPSPVRDLNASCRRAARGQLVLALYTWLIVDSASSDRNLSRLITDDYFLTYPTNIDYAKSADAVVNIASKLKDWYPDMPEKEWMKMRSSDLDSCLDDVAWRLGKPLAIALWEHFLGIHVRPSKISKGSELRLWWITMRCYSMALLLNKENGLQIDNKDEKFLNDACVYSEKLNEGLWSNVCIEGLYAISCSFPESNQNPAIKSIRDLANNRLNEQERRSVQLRIQNQ